jgi:hypothetical protein
MKHPRSGLIELDLKPALQRFSHVDITLYIFYFSWTIQVMPVTWGKHTSGFQSFTRHCKFMRDETNSICTHGSRAMPSGGLSMDGPPTTLSGTGVDRMAFLQANITRDNTEFVNGAVIGDRCIFQVCWSVPLCFWKQNSSPSVTAKRL